MTSTSAGNLMTSGEIARQIGASLRQVQYAVERLRIEPTGKAGTLHLYDESVPPRILARLRRIHGSGFGQ